MGGLPAQVTQELQGLAMVEDTHPGEMEEVDLGEMEEEEEEAVAERALL
jgi:hypothetical protein